MAALLSAAAKPGPTSFRCAPILQKWATLRHLLNIAWEPPMSPDSFCPLRLRPPAPFGEAITMPGQPFASSEKALPKTETHTVLTPTRFLSLVYLPEGFLRFMLVISTLLTNFRRVWKAIS